MGIGHASFLSWPDANKSVETGSHGWWRLQFGTVHRHASTLPASVCVTFLCLYGIARELRVRKSVGNRLLKNCDLDNYLVNVPEESSPSLPAKVSGSSLTLVRKSRINDFVCLTVQCYGNKIIP